MKTLATGGCAVLRIREHTSVVQKRFGFQENSVHHFAEMVEDSSWCEGTGSQAMSTAATAHGRGGRHARCCAREPKANENTEFQRRTPQREQDTTPSHLHAHRHQLQ